MAYGNIFLDASQYFLLSSLSSLNNNGLVDTIFKRSDPMHAQAGHGKRFIEYRITG
jgi:hypothetical protein